MIQGIILLLLGVYFSWFSKHLVDKKYNDYAIFSCGVSAGCMLFGAIAIMFSIPGCEPVR